MKGAVGTESAGRRRKLATARCADGNLFATHTSTTGLCDRNEEGRKSGRERDGLLNQSPLVVAAALRRRRRRPPCKPSRNLSIAPNTPHPTGSGAALRVETDVAAGRKRKAELRRPASHRVVCASKRAKNAGRGWAITTRKRVAGFPRVHMWMRTPHFCRLPAPGLAGNVEQRCAATRAVRRRRREEVYPGYTGQVYTWGAPTALLRYLVVAADAISPTRQYICLKLPPYLLQYSRHIQYISSCVCSTTLTILFSHHASGNTDTAQTSARLVQYSATTLPARCVVDSLPPAGPQCSGVAAGGTNK